MIRSSTTAPKAQGQFTPAIRQFSTPKHIKSNFAEYVYSYNLYWPLYVLLSRLISVYLYIMYV